MPDVVGCGSPFGVANNLRGQKGRTQVSSEETKNPRFPPAEAPLPSWVRCEVGPHPKGVSGALIYNFLSQCQAN